MLLEPMPLKPGLSLIGIHYGSIDLGLGDPLVHSIDSVSSILLLWCWVLFQHSRTGGFHSGPSAVFVMILQSRVPSSQPAYYRVHLWCIRSLDSISDAVGGAGRDPGRASTRIGRAEAWTPAPIMVPELQEGGKRFRWGRDDPEMLRRLSN